MVAIQVGVAGGEPIPGRRRLDRCGAKRAAQPQHASRGSVSATTQAVSRPTTPRRIDPPTTPRRRLRPTPTKRPGPVVATTPRCRRPVTGRAARSPHLDCQRHPPGCQLARYPRDTATSSTAVPATVNVDHITHTNPWAATRIKGQAMNTKRNKLGSWIAALAVGSADDRHIGNSRRHWPAALGHLSRHRHRAAL